MENSKIVELLKEHRDLIVVTLFFIFGSLGLIWFANVETGARLAIDSANAKASKAKCEGLEKIISEGNLTKGISVKVDDLTEARMGCSNYLKYLSSTEDSIPNIEQETRNAEETLVRIDKALEKSDTYRKNRTE
jgi:hypothetical protein